VTGSAGVAHGGDAGRLAPVPTQTCPPVPPISGAVTTRSQTISSSIFLAPPCGYDPPVTVTLFAGPQDARLTASAQDIDALRWERSQVITP
jgi:hypothetical protein